MLKQVLLNYHQKQLSSHLPGYLLATQKCMICHSADYIMYQPPGQNLEQWTKEMLKMRNTYGAPISVFELRSIAAYLAVTYGSAKATDADVIAASKVLKPVFGSKLDATEDVKQLFTSNACFGCHGIDREVIGPSFQTIASKYKDDSQALSKLATSIQMGGRGKWGSVSMPAMSNLNSPQAKALAKYVLKQ